MAMKRVVILGAGTGGTMVANRLRRPSMPTTPRSMSSISTTATSTSRGCSSSPSGSPRWTRSSGRARGSCRMGSSSTSERSTRSGSSGTSSCSTTARSSPTTCSSSPPARVSQPEETEGLTGPGWNERAFTFYTPEGAAALATALERFDGGRVVVNLVDMPIKCPVAPLEFAFLADWYFRERGIRDRVDLVFSTPLDAAFTKPIASEHLAGLLDEKAIELVTEFNAGEVDGVAAGSSPMTVASSTSTCS